MVGEVLLDRYELEELVGSGGMSSVYRAHDRLLDRTVALKILHEHHLREPEYVERFRREARSAAVLSHPNIVTVIDRGEHGGRQFIVFEFVGGDNLKQLIRQQKPLPVSTALALGIQIARALSFAHRNGLVHRDVKPQNVLLNGDGQAKVTDFGIARSLDVQRGMTETGTVLGTSDYIAPEQAQGLHVDEQTDVYSLGVVMYEMLTGDVPFPGENFVAVAMRHINEPPPSVRAKRPEVSPRVDAAVQRAMAKDPRDRFPTMADLGRELEACQGESEQGTQIIPPPRPAPTRGRRRSGAWPLLLVLGGLIAIGAVGAYLLFGRSGGSSTGGSGGGSVTLRATTAYDPYGSGPPGENNTLAYRATDGNESTFWPTERYYDEQLGKKGVGLVLQTVGSGKPATIIVTTDTPGFTAEIMAGAAANNFPDLVSGPQVVSRTTTFTIGGSAHPYYLLWITSLGLHQVDHVNEARAG